MQDALKQAVNHVFEIKKNNPEWPFGFCVSKVSNWHNIEVGLLKSECGKRGKPKNKMKQQSKKFQRGSDGYPIDTPWWIKS